MIQENINIESVCVYVYVNISNPNILLKSYEIYF